MDGRGVEERERDRGDVRVRLDCGPVSLTVGHIEPIKSRGDCSVRVAPVRDVGVRSLDHLLKSEVILETSPALGKIASAVIVCGVCGSVFILIFNEVEVPPHKEKGSSGDSLFQGCELLRSDSKANRAKVDVKCCKTVRAIFGIKGDAQSVAAQGIRECNFLVVIEQADAGGDNSGHPSSSFGKVAIVSKIFLGKETPKEILFPKI
jgi:hypothetical protein